jgi:hypothetical protein
MAGLVLILIPHGQLQHRPEYQVSMQAAVAV